MPENDLFKFHIGSHVRIVDTRTVFVVMERIYTESRAGQFRLYKLLSLDNSVNAIAPEVELIYISEPSL